MVGKLSRKLGAAVALVGVGALALGGCAQTSGSDSSSSSINVGTTDKVISLDPAAAYDNGSFVVSVNVNPFLLTIKPNGNKLVGDIAESFKFVNPTTYEVKLKKGLKFANGHDLTSSDVKFSFDRMTKINDPEGPQALLGNLKETVVKDPQTVDFILKIPNDQTFPQVLTTPAAPIVDEQVYSADKVTPADKIVKEKAFGGPYEIQSYKENQLITYKANPNYKGLHKPENKDVSVQYMADETNLQQKVENGEVDVAYRTLSPTAIDKLAKNSKLKVHQGPGGELRYMVFNTDTMPYGAKQPDADPAKALAVRQAIADTVDRAAIGKDVYKGTYAPAYSMVPDALANAKPSFKSVYGDGKGGPSVEKAKKVLEDAGVKTPVKLDIEYSPDHYGKSSGDEYAAIKQQLEASKLFTVNLQSTTWTTYSEKRIKEYPIYQLGWFPDFSDADNYLQPFFTKTNFVQSYNNALDPELEKVIATSEGENDAKKRGELLGQAQDLVAKNVLILPLLSGKQIAVSQKDIKGVVLDASFKFYYSTLTK